MGFPEASSDKSFFTEEHSSVNVTESYFRSVRGIGSTVIGETPDFCHIETADSMLTAREDFLALFLVALLKTRLTWGV